MTPKKLQTLLLEDSEDDALLILRVLKKGGYQPSYQIVETKEAFCSALERQSWDVILSDFSMPTFNALQALQILQQKELDIPFIVISGAIGEDVAVECMRSGAHDYLIKGNLARLVPAIDRELREAKVRQQNRLALQALKESEIKYKKLYHNAPVMYLTLNLKGEITEVNQTALEKLNSKKENLIGKDFFSLFTAKTQEKLMLSYPNLLEKGYISGEGQLNSQNQTIDVIYTLNLEYSLQQPSIVRLTCLDISELKRLQQQLVHSDRLASLGRLAAGISHEINQPLACISMSAEILLSKLNSFSPPPIFQEELQDILKQVDRINRIIQNIKTFSRDFGHSFPSPVNINQILHSSLQLVRHDMEKNNIEFCLELQENIPTIKGDICLLEQVFVNLLLNAKDALEEKNPPRKQIYIRTFCQNQNIFVKIKDNGIGIERENLEKIFDPFYTTKEVGVGTGLGLAISYGIITELHGRIECQSQKGEWTQFTITLPLNCEKSTKTSV
ncbi:MAG: hybrid sensor histidine kinase/response regulator [Planctomycetota bacterium]|nr:MAG: hybrid sensor histidine kinase/response regulator [Planctomycetota bacterium]